MLILVIISIIHPFLQHIACFSDPVPCNGIPVSLVTEDHPAMGCHAYERWNTLCHFTMGPEEMDLVKMPVNQVDEFKMMWRFQDPSDSFRGLVFE